MVCGSFVFVVSAFLTAPSKILGLPNSITIMRIGLIVGGIGRVLTQGPSEAYLMNAV